jgi:uridine kinase
MEKIHNFRIFLETTLRQIANRTELRDKPVDMKRVDKIINQYLESV